MTTNEGDKREQAGFPDVCFGFILFFFFSGIFLFLLAFERKEFDIGSLKFMFWCPKVGSFLQSAEN